MVLAKGHMSRSNTPSENTEAKPWYVHVLVSDHYITKHYRALDYNEMLFENQGDRDLKLIFINTMHIWLTEVSLSWPYCFALQEIS